MFGNTSGVHKEEVVAVADVGSGSAAFAIVKRGGGKPAHVLAASRSILPMEERSKEQMVSGVIRMLSEASSSVLKDYSEGELGKKWGPPKEVYAIIRAPWTRASAGRTRSEFEADTLITKEIIAEAGQKAFNTNKETDQSQELEASVVRVILNGYPTAKPVGKKAHSIEVVTFETDCDAAISSGTRSTLEQLLPGRNLVLRSGAWAYLSLVQDQMKVSDSFVIADMVSEATTVIVVRNGLVAQHAVLPEGVRTILRRVAGGKGTPEETVSLIRMVVAGSCAGDECDKLNEALGRVEPELVRVFGEAVSVLDGKQRLPSTLVLFVHPDLAPWLTRFFARIDFAQFTIPLQPFTVVPANTDSLKDFVGVEDGHEPDYGILVASAFVNT